MKQLIQCADCTADISPDAEACPSCGRINDWIHPTLEKVKVHLHDQEFETAIEARGHEMILQATTYTFRQQIGGLFIAIAIGCLILGFFVQWMMGLAALGIIIGGALTGFGLSASTRKDLHIDLRKPGKTVGSYDRAFWLPVLEIIDA